MGETRSVAVFRLRDYNTAVLHRGLWAFQSTGRCLGKQLSWSPAGRNAWGSDMQLDSWHYKPSRQGRDAANPAAHVAYADTWSWLMHLRSEFRNTAPLWKWCFAQGWLQEVVWTVGRSCPLTGQTQLHPWAAWGTSTLGALPTQAQLAPSPLLYTQGQDLLQQGGITDNQRSPVQNPMSVERHLYLVL